MKPAITSLASAITLLLLSAQFNPVFAHTTEQGFVLLLPTKVYIWSGVLAVLITTLALCVLPNKLSHQIFSESNLFCIKQQPAAKTVFSLLSFCTLLWWLTSGLLGPHDPLKNILPLSIWTLFWMGFVVLNAALGNVWNWLNPWSGPYQLIVPKAIRENPPLRLSEQFYYVPAIVLLLACTAFVLADIAPEDPLRLFWVVSVYWLATFLALILFGETVWFKYGEFLSVMLSAYSKLGPLQRVWLSTTQSQLRIGLPAWHLRSPLNRSMGFSCFIVTLLACGSFDGLNETFWWLAKIGVNPLAFPGRSAVVGQTVVGILIASVALFVVVALCIKLGLVLVAMHYRQSGSHTTLEQQSIRFRDAFAAMSVSLLPIALAYHFAHYLTSFLVNAQYALQAYSDPLNNGADILNLGQHFVSTGFLNTRDSVKAIWLTQGLAVVTGHLLSVLLAHNIALQLHKNRTQAILSQTPFAVLMVCYTFLGLWLLAAPRGA